MTSGKDTRSQTSTVVEGVCDHVVEIDLARPRVETAPFGEGVEVGVDSSLWRDFRFVGDAFVGDSSGGGNWDG